MTGRMVELERLLSLSGERIRLDLKVGVSRRASATKSA